MSQRSVFSPAVRLLSGLALCLCLPWASAQDLPVAVTVAGNVATVRVDLPAQPQFAEVTLAFDDASGLSAASLGVSARLVNVSDPALLARLPDGSVNQLQAAFPVMLTIEPPAQGGLSFRRTVHVEVHTHALSYAAGSPLRLFKAPVGGSFRDITDDIAPGSIRARGTTGGFSQFLVLADLRATSAVVADKFARLQALVEQVPLAERGPLQMDADSARAAYAQGRYADALTALDRLRARVQDRAGVAIADEWRATRDVDNVAGELLASANTLGFSIGYQRDYGH